MNVEWKKWATRNKERKKNAYLSGRRTLCLTLFQVIAGPKWGCVSINFFMEGGK
jgi:hypothetical protein